MQELKEVGKEFAVAMLYFIPFFGIIASCVAYMLHADVVLYCAVTVTVVCVIACIGHYRQVLTRVSAKDSIMMPIVSSDDIARREHEERLHAAQLQQLEMIDALEKKIESVKQQFERTLDYSGEAI